MRGRGIVQQLIARRPDRGDYRRELAINHVQEGHLRKALREPAKVLPCYQEARKILEKLSEAEGDNPWVKLDLSRVYRYLADEYRSRPARVSRPWPSSTGRGRPARPWAAPNRQVPAFRQELALILSRMASLYRATAQHDRASTVISRRWWRCEKLATDHPELPGVGLESARPVTTSAPRTAI